MSYDGRLANSLYRGGDRTDYSVDDNGEDLRWEQLSQFF